MIAQLNNLSIVVAFDERFDETELADGFFFIDLIASS